MQATTPQACNQFLAHKSAASYPKRHLYTGFACGIADPDWEFIDREYSNSCHETGAALAYKFASEENPMQLRNDTGGMDDDEFNDEDEGVDVVYPYQQYMNKAATVASEEEMSDVPECEMSSSHEGSVIDDDVLDRMDAVANSGFGTGAFSHCPVVLTSDGGDEVMEIEMGIQMDDISVDSSKKRKRWADDDDNAQQQIHQLQYPTQTKFAGAPWGALQQNNAKRDQARRN
ncbi:unnamed protein product [Tuber melanosporum]|uniref:(Perigord truffle) hypothetical protein n=1 Tax=Tuber melanosporum (strain Mel28) TaxID=656061 RepID=D5G5U8_TUBMM|nr:uncharacterized protein GSTUM_00001584001 [Tuber melanosporum]CAZ79891.1 unnamed protein product [Tuber melanosporum]